MTDLARGFELGRRPEYPNNTGSIVLSFGGVLMDALIVPAISDRSEAARPGRPFTELFL
jgi:hypothetical protein